MHYLYWAGLVEIMALLGLAYVFYSDTVACIPLRVNGCRPVKLKNLICARARYGHNKQCFMCDELAFIAHTFEQYGVLLLVCKHDLHGALCVSAGTDSVFIKEVYKSVFEALCEVQRCYGRITHNSMIVHCNPH